MKVKRQLFNHGRNYPGCIDDSYVQRVVTSDDPWGMNPGWLFKYPHCEACAKTNAKDRKLIGNCAAAAELQNHGGINESELIASSMLQKIGCATVLVGILSMPLIGIKCASSAAPTPQNVEQQNSQVK